MDPVTLYIFYVTVSAVGVAVLFGTMLIGGDADADHDGDVDNADGPSVFSLRTIALFLTGYGGIGLAVTANGGTVVVSSIAGILSGLAAALTGYYIARILWSQQGSSTVGLYDLVDCVGRIVDLTDEHQGLVEIERGGSRSRFPARAPHGISIATGTRVRVVDSGGGVLLVTTSLNAQVS